MVPVERIAVVIPCLNEAETIGALVEKVRRILPFVLVVDDGSTDQTASLAAQSGAEIIRHSEPQGKGAALQAGWTRLHQLGFEFVLTLDGDGQHSPNDIPKFLAALKNNALIVGNRMAEVGKIPFVRRQTNRWMSRRLSELAKQNLPDTQCGFRLMNLQAWSKLQLITTHYEIESELLLAFAAAGYAIAFVPIEVIYENEESKIQPFRDTVRWFRWYFKMRKKFKIASVQPAVEPAKI
ncbi:MAG: glycosyltransferase family 2 protein [Verrucomicrobiota bacterium]|nr:glycosyltransferase family 2 protein [Verrucomicrobiota bacterium]